MPMEEELAGLAAADQNQEHLVALAKLIGRYHRELQQQGLEHEMISDLTLQTNQALLWRVYGPIEQ